MEPTKREVTKHGNQRWEVDFGIQPGGWRKRPIFNTEKEADDAIAEFKRIQKRHGELWLRLTPSERTSLMGVYDEVTQAGLTIRAVWDTYRADHGEKPVEESVPFKDAIEELRTRKLESGKDERYVDELCSLHLRFGEGRLEKHIDQISVKELQEWIRAQEWGLSAKKRNYGRFSSLWSMAVDLGWAPFNIVDCLSRRRIVKSQINVHWNRMEGAENES